ncbi:MAG: hypothetical protein HQL11_04890, partial [Candidatus Omnitrophica bacterium]|nr:hypothetical protein [Candidatus Omnitrophota bacterium]
PVLATLVLANGLVHSDLRDGSRGFERLFGSLTGGKLPLDAEALAKLESYDPNTDYQPYEVLPMKLRAYLDVVLYLQNLVRQTSDISA